MITKWNVSRGKTAIFIGSSVCVGSGATNNRGWSKMVAERMEVAAECIRTFVCIGLQLTMTQFKNK